MFEDLLSKKQRALAAFEASIEQISPVITTANLPRHVRILNPKQLLPSYKVKGVRYTFSVYSTGKRGVSEMKPHAGIILSTHADSPDKRSPNDHQFFASLLDTRSASIFVNPVERFDERDNEFDSTTTSFAHVVLLFRNNKPIIFIPTIQKITGQSLTEGRNVDRFVGIHGPSRHLLHLAIAHKIVEKMNECSVNAELHVPAPQHFRPRGVSEAVKQRIRAPYMELQKHFSGSRIKIGNETIRTINLSQLKRKS